VTRELLGTVKVGLPVPSKNGFAYGLGLSCDWQPVPA
jgi:hypothetical protein